jgi:hypothetical protein
LVKDEEALAVGKELDIAHLFGAAEDGIGVRSGLEPVETR